MPVVFTRVRTRGCALRFCALFPGVAVRVAGLPAPAVGAHALEVIFRNPTELVARLVAGGVVLGDVACAARLDGVGNLVAAGLLEGTDDVEHARSLAGAQVEDAHAAAGSALSGLACNRADADGLARADATGHPVERGNVAASQVDHVDVVAHARAIGGGVVVSEDAHALELAYGNLRHVGKQVVRDALRVLADESALMGADGVEVAQQHDVPLVVADVEVAQNAFEHALRLAVGIGGLVLGAGFGDGDELRLAVDGGARGEHDVLHAVGARYVAEYERAGNVVPVVLERLGNALANGFIAGEVDYGVHLVRGEDVFERLAVEDARLIELQAIGLRALCDAGDGANAVERDLARVAQVVNHDDGVAAIEQLHAGVAADEAGAAGDEDCGFLGSFSKALVGHSVPFSFRAVSLWRQRVS